MKLQPARLEVAASLSWTKYVLSLLRQHRHFFSDHVCLRLLRQVLGDHLAVHTPWRPDGGDNRTMPVMFFIHGGAFMSGTQIRYFYREVPFIIIMSIESTVFTTLALHHFAINASS